MYTQAFLLMLLLCAASARAAVSSDAMSSRRAELRRACAMATQSMEHAEKMLEDLDEVTESEPLAYGYRAMAEFLISHHSYNPVTKYRRFTSAKETLEKAVQAAPDLPELRYLRFTIQSRLPSMLPRTKHMLDHSSADSSKHSSTQASLLFSTHYALPSAHDAIVLCPHRCTGAMPAGSFECSSSVRCRRPARSARTDTAARNLCLPPDALGRAACLANGFEW